MKPVKFIFIITTFISVFAFSCNNEEKKAEVVEPNIKEEAVTYQVDSLNMKSYLFYDENKTGKRPAVLVIHEWWGLNDYPKTRAKQLATMGYVAMAVDMYGNDQLGNDPESAGKLSAPFYQDPEIAKRRFDAALDLLKTDSLVDQSNIAAIGYCFGGGIVLNLAKMGEPLNGVVSFHGVLAGIAPDKDLTKAEILVCHGQDDKFVPQDQVDEFKKQMDSIGKQITFRSYPGATHAFTNPAATENGKKFDIPIAYNAAADSASWQEMKDFFAKIFKHP